MTTPRGPPLTTRTTPLGLLRLITTFSGGLPLGAHHYLGGPKVGVHMGSLGPQEPEGPQGALGGGQGSRGGHLAGAPHRGGRMGPIRGGPKMAGLGGIEGWSICQIYTFVSAVSPVSAVMYRFPITIGAKCQSNHAVLNFDVVCTFTKL